MLVLQVHVSAEEKWIQPHQSLDCKESKNVLRLTFGFTNHSQSGGFCRHKIVSPHFITL